MAEYATVPAGRNIVHDPKPATLNYLTVSSGTLSLSTEDSFSGLYSAYLNIPSAGSIRTFEWRAGSDDDADLAAIPAGSLIAGWARVKTIAVTGTVTTAGRVTYTDGTYDETTGSSPTVGTTFVKLGSFVLSNAAKTIRNVSFRIYVGTGSTFEGFVGGYDVRVGASPDSFIHGDAGEGYAWEGAANNSPSTREAFVATPVFGTGGQYTPTLTVEVISRWGGTLRDITSHVLDASVTYDLDADQHKGTCNLVLDEPGLVEVLGDEWVRFSLRIDRPDGSVEEGPVGVFILDPPKERWNEGADQWTYPGRDITSLLTTTFIRGVPEFLVLPTGTDEVVLRGSYFAKEGTSYRAILEDVLLNDVGLRRDQFSFSADLPQFLEDNIGWEPVVPVMEIVTDTLEGAGWMSPWASPAGIITSAPAGVNPATVTPAITLSTGNNSRVRWPFEVDADAGGIGNRVRVISAKDVTSVTRRTKKKRGKKKKKVITQKSTKRHAIEVWRMNNDPSHPLSFPRLGRWLDLPDVEQPLVQSTSEATALADQALIEGGQLPMRVRLVTEAMVRGLNEVYELDLKDHLGEPIASGQGRYWCRGWTIQLGSPWEMTHNLSRTIDFQAASFVSE